MFDQVGQYRVLSGQRVYINDPLTLAAVLGDIPQKLNKQTHPPDVILSFSFAPIPRTYPQFDNRTQGPLSDPDRQAHSRLGFNANFVLDTIAATAGFGGNPVLPPEPPQKTGSEHERLSMDPLLFSVDSPFNGAIRVVRSIPDNAYGCDDYPPNVLHDPLAAHPYPKTADEEGKGTSPPASSPSPPPPPSSSSSPHLAPAVLFVRRGECTFLRKVITAKRANFAGVIVWNEGEGSESGGGGKLVSPSVDKGEEEWARREVWDVSVVVVGKEDGEVLNEMLNVLEREDDDAGSSGWEVVVGVKGKGNGGKQWNEYSLPTQLYINGLALRNTILVT